MEEVVFYFELLRNKNLCKSYEKDFIRGIVKAKSENEATCKLERLYGKVDYQDLHNSKVIEIRVYDHSIIEF